MSERGRNEGRQQTRMLRKPVSGVAALPIVVLELACQWFHWHCGLPRLRHRRLPLSWGCFNRCRKSVLIHQSKSVRPEEVSVSLALRRTRRTQDNKKALSSTQDAVAHLLKAWPFGSCSAKS